MSERWWWIDALERWKDRATDPGDFLLAVLSNDLFGAYGRADEFSKADMAMIVMHIYNNLPSGCWGSREKVEAWKGFS